MVSHSYFGRPEPDGRHLGSDLRLISDWCSILAKDALANNYAHTQAFPLSKLSKPQQSTLFSKSAHEFRVEQGPNGTIKLEQVGGDENAAPCSSNPSEATIRQQVAAMLEHPNYKKARAKGNADANAMIESIEYRAEDAEAVKAAALSIELETKAPEAAQRRAEEIAFNFMVRVGQEARKQLQAARVDYTKHGASRATSATSEAVKPPRSAWYKSVGGATKMHNVSAAQAINSNRSRTTPPAKGPAQLASPFVSTPDSDRRTTRDSVSSDSPHYSTDATTPPPPVDQWSKEGQDFSVTSKSGSGVGLHNAQSTATPAHLGAGVNQAFLSQVYLNQTYVNGSVAAACSQPANNSTLLVGITSSINAATHAQGIQGAAYPYILTASTYPKASFQPYTGMTCYIVPFQGARDELVPAYTTTKSGKQRFVVHKTRELKLQDAELRADPEMGEVARAPIHIFVDLSNIIIGFYGCMKTRRGMPVNKRIKAPHFSFDNLNLILTRDRPVEKMIVAGSIGINSRVPGYMVEAHELGYEMNIMQRVQKPVSPMAKRLSKNGAGAVDNSGADSGDEYTGKVGEQGVDEVLHLKILQSAMDTPECGTIVLATGDAAHAEYSDGFKKNIERVLAFGWNIELYGWRQNISSAWRDPEFAETWGHQFRLIELDDFCEELHAHYIPE
ncbi:hypothetical protein QBC46DRAFT_268690 [Diplogelasinospora grovesii]|uniref:NYN domain-containing protein n=1 Tax=Diplogelasinospora grovesii TaxID=303347 RepID=A0AAN6N2Z0_9PEZI|nr:hypothetical protein QBC46DRAFT_268690 [Diplogelasinospora grovesii]